MAVNIALQATVLTEALCPSLHQWLIFRGQPAPNPPWAKGLD